MKVYQNREPGDDVSGPVFHEGSIYTDIQVVSSDMTLDLLWP